ncbi:MAG: acetoacetyl-CoA reductase [Gammaproteobacteria bacterium]|nr:acetoacetyl-CoA reductase [Gammaproteobacteria bacterium]
MLKCWHDPVEFSLNSFFGFTEFAHTSVSQLAHHHTDAFTSYFNPEPARSGTLNRKTGRRIETNRVAVVTGGIGGIGTEICKRLFNDGNQVVATFIAIEAEHAGTWQKKHRKEGYAIDIIECNVTDFSSCKKMSRQLEKEYGRVDILVNCAGITRDFTLRNMEIEHWHAVLDTNLDSVFNVTRNFINHMIKQGYGRIINISSVNGQKGQFGQTNYSAAKAGMIGFTKSLALELADNGITVNTVCPGYVGTSMVEAIPEHIKNNIIAKIPVGRLAKPAEIADAVAFLAAENSSYITGSEISINGGLYMG